uniref:NR LBD domain-containing protein n=1 Tax=Meloidogyne hapla TaxID=6305 RepID=A0A1I8BKB5_MELHA
MQRNDNKCQVCGSGLKISSTTINEIFVQDKKEIDSLISIVEAKKRILHAFNDLDDVFLNGPILFEDIILSEINIFNHIEIFSQNPSPLSEEEMLSWKKEFKNEVDFKNQVVFSKRTQKCFLVNQMICVGIVELLPVFRKLSIADKVAQLRHISSAFMSFTCSFISWELGMDTWTRKDCVMPALAITKYYYLMGDANNKYVWLLSSLCVLERFIRPMK